VGDVEPVDTVVDPTAAAMTAVPDRHLRPLPCSSSSSNNSCDNKRMNRENYDYGNKISTRRDNKKLSYRLETGRQQRISL